MSGSSFRKGARPRCKPLLVRSVAALFVLGSAGLTSACGSGTSEEDITAQCVVQVRPDQDGSKIDDVDVVTVDPKYCDDDRTDFYYGGYHYGYGGYPVFINTGGGFYGMPIGTSYRASTVNNGGSTLVRSTDNAARTSIGVPKGGTAKIGSSNLGKTTVKSGGIGFGSKSGGGFSGGRGGGS